MTHLLLAAALLTSSALASPPQVVSATPDNADFAVDPSLTVLRVTFDQNMDPESRSICGGGPAFPTFTGKVFWENPRTLVIPVKLEPDHLYVFSINCPAAQNFKSAPGPGQNAESVIPYPITFRTAAAAGGQQPITFGAPEVAEMTKKLRDAIDNKYSYRDRLKIDWNALFASDRTLSSVTTSSGFARAAAKLLGAAKDPHLNLLVKGMGGPTKPDSTFTLVTYPRLAVPNINTRWIVKNIPGLKARSPAVSAATFQDGVGYILIDSWSGTRGEFIALHEVIKEFIAAKAPGLVIDVRHNGGGSETFAQEFAAHFITTPSVYSRNTIRDKSAPSGFSGPFDRKIEPAPEAERYSGKVALLMGNANLSSCESFILMMKQSPNVRTFGTTSGGSSGNPKPVDLGFGVTMLVPSWVDMLPDGTELEGRGITPDEQVDAPPQVLENSDPVLQFALRWLRTAPMK